MGSSSGSLIRETRFEDHDGVAASDRVVDRRRGFGEAGFDNPLANGAGGPGRAGADVVGLPGRPLVLCGGPRFGSASSDGPALRRAGAGLWSNGGARRSGAAEATPHPLSGMAFEILLRRAKSPYT